MGKVTGFLGDRPAGGEVPAGHPTAFRHFREFTIPMSDQEVQKQSARCMDCGISLLSRADGVPGAQPDPGLERPRL